jgi:hypothetical protein
MWKWLRKARSRRNGHSASESSSAPTIGTAPETNVPTTAPRRHLDAATTSALKGKASHIRPSTNSGSAKRKSSPPYSACFKKTAAVPRARTGTRNGSSTPCGGGVGLRDDASTSHPPRALRCAKHPSLQQSLVPVRYEHRAIIMENLGIWAQLPVSAVGTNHEEVASEGPHLGAARKFGFGMARAPRLRT